MRRSLIATTVAAALLSIVVLVSFSVAQQQGEPSPQSDAEAAEASPAGEKITPEQAMAAMMKYGTPGPEHEKLKKSAGTFDAEVTFQMGPDAPPDKSKGKMVNEVILDGRFVKSDYTGEFAGHPFTGFGLMGYDNLKKKYVSLWADSVSTAMMLTEGEADASGKVITLTGEYQCPITHQQRRARQVVTIIDDDHHVFEAYDVGPDGKEFKTMTIKYRRVK